MWIVLIILGVAVEIVKANSWFIIPDICTYVLFGLGGLLAVIQFIIFVYTKKQFNRVSKRIHRR